MTFKDLVLQEKYADLPALRMEPQESAWKGFITNHSPIMKLWFILMVVNLVFVIWMI